MPWYYIYSYSFSDKPYKFPHTTYDSKSRPSGSWTNSTKIYSNSFPFCSNYLVNSFHPWPDTGMWFFGFILNCIIYSFIITFGWSWYQQTSDPFREKVNEYDIRESAKSVDIPKGCVEFTLSNCFTMLFRKVFATSK